MIATMTRPNFPAPFERRALRVRAAAGATGHDPADHRAHPLAHAQPAPRPPAGWVHVEHVHCHVGHHIARDRLPLPAGGVRCSAQVPVDPRDPHGRRHDCGRWLYTVHCGAAGLVYVVFTTWPHVEAIAYLDLPPLAALEFLGAEIAGAA